MHVFDLPPEVVARFADAGGVPAQSTQALARESDMVITCLPTSAEVRDVLFGKDQVAEVHADPRQTVRAQCRRRHRPAWLSEE
jgi:3-hydroxyisobutyrate dehydrogenase-like beta-hydroxyacid dehydrogenase